MTIQVNIRTAVNSAKIRRETHNGREHIVIPSYTLPADVVMNGILYPASEIDKHYPGLEGTLAPLGHPQVDGKFVSAFTPEAINVNHIGAYNRNVKKVGDRIYLEKWVDIEVAQQSERGREFLERIEQLEAGEAAEPIHTSVAVFLTTEPATNEQKAAGADKGVAVFEAIDHDAILLHEVGAATPEQGVGLMVNADEAVKLRPNAGALVGESYREKDLRLGRAARQQFQSEGGVWLEDFTDSQAVISFDGETKVYGYKEEAGKIVFEAEGQPVVRQESWAVIAANRIKRIFKPQARPVSNQEDAEMALTPEEKAELVKDLGSALAANLQEQLKPLADAVSELQANQKTLADTLTANARAEEAAKREAVAAKLGEVVANALSGDALDEAFAKLADPATIAANHAGGNADEPKFDEVPD